MTTDPTTITRAQLLTALDTLGMCSSGWYGTWPTVYDKADDHVNETGHTVVEIHEPAD